MQQNNTKLLGKWGEAEAAKYLTSRGYKITAAGYKSRFGEIDLIAENVEFVVFVEVKLRKSSDYINAAAYVDKYKQKKLITTAQMWLSEHETTLQPRFDVVEIYAPNGIAKAPERINHIESAFDCEGYV